MYKLSKILLVSSKDRLIEKIATAMRNKFENINILKANNMVNASKYITENKNIDIAIIDFDISNNILKIIQNADIPTILLADEITKQTRDIICKYNIVDYISTCGRNFLTEIVLSTARIIKNHYTNILVVDDSKFQRATLVDILKKQKFNVYTASDGKEAYKLLTDKKVEFSIVLTDYIMPNMDGLELTFEIRKLYAKDEIGIIVLSASDNMEIPTEFIRIGANDFITKPYNQIEVTTRINANLEILDMFKCSKDLANKDFMTGAYNRRFFFESADAIFKKALRAKKELCVAMVDIDKFKNINDTYGHDVGDLAIKETVRILNLNLRSSDLMARFGGEEFCILLENISLKDAKVLLEKIRVAFEKNILKAFENDIKFTVSIGIRFGLDEDLETMIKKADDGLYYCKENGRNQVAINKKANT